jgi:hypothetical protein
MSHGNLGTLFPVLDARLWGTDVFTAGAGVSSSHYIYIPFNCKFNGLDFFSWNPNKGDSVSFLTEYPVSQEVWRRYKKFAKKFNVYPNTRDRVILFPTEPKAGVRIHVIYHNVGQTPVDFSFNFFTYVEQAKIDPTKGEQGEDW